MDNATSLFYLWCQGWNTIGSYRCSTTNVTTFACYFCSIRFLEMDFTISVRWRVTKLMIIMTLASSYTFLAIGICADGVSVCSYSLSMDRHRSWQVSATKCYPSRNCETSSSSPSLSFTNNIDLVVWNVRSQDCSCRFICHLCRNVSIAFAERCSYAILQLRTLSRLAVRSCIIACEHLSVKAILPFLHRWQINLHEQSWLRTFHTTKYILFVKLSDGDDELVSQLRDG